MSSAEDEGGEQMEDSAGGSAGGGAGHKRKWERVSTAKLLALLRTPELEALIRLAHASLTEGSAFKSKAIALFPEALTAGSKEDIPLANYLAHLVALDFRYVCDPTQDLGRGTALKLFQFNGALWRCVGNTEANMDDVLKGRLIQVVSEFEQGLQSLRLPEEEQEGGGEEQEEAWSKKPAAPADLRAQLILLTSTYKQSMRFNRVFKVVKTRMQTDTFYTDVLQPTPSEFYNLLDAEQHVLGFNNGVFSFREADNIFRFYPTGAVPTRFAVSRSVGYDYVGPLEWPRATPEAGVTDDNRFSLPRLEDYEPLAEWKTGIETADKKYVHRMFFRDTVYTAVAFVIGATIFGGNLVKKIVVFLGEQGDNGKSKLLLLMGMVLGDHYCQPLAKAFIFETKALPQNPNSADPFLSAAHNCRLAGCSEIKRGEKLDSDKSKRWSGKDKEATRANWGNNRSVVVQFIMWIASNFAPAYDNNDPALCKRLYPIPCDALFTKDPTLAEDPSKGVWRATNDSTFDEEVQASRMDLMLLFIWFARAFADAGANQLPPVPEGTAKTALLESAAAAGFETWFTSGWESTLRAGTSIIDWAKYKNTGAIKLTDLCTKYKDDTGEEVTSADARQTLKKLGFEVRKEVKPPSQLPDGTCIHLARMILAVPAAPRSS